MDDSATRIKINSATIEELSTLFGVGPSLARRIIEWRARHGPFRGPHDLSKVPGVGHKRAQLLAPYIDWSGEDQHDPGPGPRYAVNLVMYVVMLSLSLCFGLLALVAVIVSLTSSNTSDALRASPLAIGLLIGAVYSVMKIADYFGKVPRRRSDQVAAWLMLAFSVAIAFGIAALSLNGDVESDERVAVTTGMLGASLALMGFALPTLFPNIATKVWIPPVIDGLSLLGAVLTAAGWLSMPGDSLLSIIGIPVGMTALIRGWWAIRAGEGARMTAERALAANPTPKPGRLDVVADVIDRFLPDPGDRYLAYQHLALQHARPRWQRFLSFLLMAAGSGVIGWAVIELGTRLFN